MPRTEDLADYGPLSAAHVLATIAYPGGDELPMRALTKTRLFGGWLRRQCALNPAILEQQMLLKPKDFLLDDRALRGGSKQLLRRFEARLFAGRVALPFFMFARGEESPAFVGKRPTLAAAARAALGPGAEHRYKDRLARNLPASRPVLHLCTAWAALNADDVRSGRPVIDLDGLLGGGSSLGRLLFEAETIVPDLAKTRFAIKPQELIHFRRMG